MNEKVYKNPSLAVDAVVLRDTKGYREILLIERKNEPHGWAFPGGFVDYGEATTAAVARELEEETGLTTTRVRLLAVASDPDRDPRQHVVSVVYECEGISGTAIAADDAKDARWFPLRQLPTMAFDHEKIIKDNLL